MTKALYKKKPRKYGCNWNVTAGVITIAAMTGWLARNRFMR